MKFKVKHLVISTVTGELNRQDFGPRWNVVTGGKILEFSPYWERLH